MWGLFAVRFRNPGQENPKRDVEAADAEAVSPGSMLASTTLGQGRTADISTSGRRGGAPELLVPSPGTQIRGIIQEPFREPPCALSDKSQC